MGDSVRWPTSKRGRRDKGLRDESTKTTSTSVIVRPELCPCHPAHATLPMPAYRECFMDS